MTITAMQTLQHKVENWKTQTYRLGCCSTSSLYQANHWSSNVFFFEGCWRTFYSTGPPDCRPGGTGCLTDGLEVLAVWLQAWRYWLSDCRPGGTGCLTAGLEVLAAWLQAWRYWPPDCWPGGTGRLTAGLEVLAAWLLAWKYWLPDC